MNFKFQSWFIAWWNAVKQLSLNVSVEVSGFQFNLKFQPFVAVFVSLRIPFNEVSFYRHTMCLKIESKTFNDESIKQRFSLLFNPLDKWIKLNILKNRKILDKRCHQFPSTRSRFTHFKIDFVRKFITSKAATEADSKRDGIAVETSLISRLIYSVNDIINFCSSSRIDCQTQTQDLSENQI